MFDDPSSIIVFAAVTVIFFIIISGIDFYEEKNICGPSGYTALDYKDGVAVCIKFVDGKSYYKPIKELRRDD